MLLLRQTRLDKEEEDQIAGVIEWLAIRTQRWGYFQGTFQGFYEKTNQGNSSIPLRDYIRFTATSIFSGDGRCALLAKKFKPFSRWAMSPLNWNTKKS